MFVGWGGIALWFIPVLFVSEMLFYWIWKLVNRYRYKKVYAMVMGVMILLSGYYFYIRNIRFPLQLEVVGMGCFFYSVGYIFNHCLKKIRIYSWLVCVDVCVHGGDPMAPHFGYVS